MRAAESAALGHWMGTKEARMSKSIMETVAECKKVVPSVSPTDAMTMLDRDDVVVVDVREASEIAESGKIPGALHVSRGMLEFHADETTPYHNKAFAKDKTIVLYCASGGRAALSGKALIDLGYTNVHNLGGFKDWVEAGGAVER